uniref:Uncharacterized mitochondrial protein AtMg00810-like n=1 Tax=Tanacetum cinerariifolium TaxID=118510 RepID=A0A6L2NUE6_TANCI|nr:uncharacterized mitochondrial protein AtMg00810-like [Tanacetum cinerariifolium]
MSYLSEFEEINGGYVVFGGNPKGGKIIGKGKIRTGKLDFDDVYFVKELKFNLFSVSQMCDTKNNVLFTYTKCTILSFDFKLPDDIHVLLRVPRENSMYNVDLKNIVPSGDLTCLFAKATLDKSNLWHRRLGHINFKTMNKLVKGKFNGKTDEGFLVGYSVSNKALEEWPYMIVTLTQSMKYEPVVTGNQPNSSAGIQEYFDAGKAGKGNVQQYVLLPLWSLRSKDPQNTDADATFEVKEPESAVHVSPRVQNLREEFEEFSSNSTTGVNAASVLVTAAEPNSTNSTKSFNAAGPSNSVEEGIDYEEVFAPVARIEAIRLFLAYASFMGFMVYQIDVKSAFLYGTIKEKVYVCQPPGFEDLDYPDKVYKVVKALYGLHQAPRACQDKYVAEILKKFGLTDGKSANTPIDTEKPLLKDFDGEDVDVHTYRSMIGSLMYLTSSRLDIMFAVCACDRFQVTPKISHLHAVKRIFRYLKGKPHLGLWYPKDLPFNLVAYSDSDYARASLDRKSTTRGCQFLGCRLISWQCKKQIVVATSSTKAEYVATASCCAQVLWIQNQLLDYGLIITTVSLKLLLFGLTIDVAHLMLLGHKCMSAKRTAWNEFSSSMASAVICLATETCDTLTKQVSSLEQDKVAQAIEITKLKQRTRRLEKKRRLKTLGLKRLRKVVTTVATTISDAQVPKANAPRRRKGVVIHDPKETATTSAIMHSEAKEQDEAYARESEAELNANINWSDVMDQVKRKEKQDNTIMRYQAMKRKHITKAHARKNMILYLKNIARFKMDFFRGMTYTEIRPIFEKHYTSIQAFLDKGDTEIKEKGSKRKNDSTGGKEISFNKIHSETMLNNVRLEVKEESEMSLELLRYIVPTGRVIVPTGRGTSCCSEGIKGRTTLLQSIPDDHIAYFHYMDDQEFLKFRINETEGFHKGYDRIQKILSQLNQLNAKPDTKEINLRFLRALPSLWSQVALTLKTKSRLEFISFDDLYYKLKTLEVDVRGYNTFSPSQSTRPSHSAFVSATSTNKKMSYGDSPTHSSTTTYSVPSYSKTGSYKTGNIEKLDLEEIDLKWQMAMLSIRVHKFEQKAGRKIDFDKKESTRFNKQKVRCYKCQQRGHFARECRSKGGNDKQRYSLFKVKEIKKKEEDSKALVTIDTLVDLSNHDSESDEVLATKEFGMIAGCDSTDVIKAGANKLFNLINGANFEEANTPGDAGEFALMGVTSERINADCETAKKDLQTKLDNHLVQTEKWRTSSKNLYRLIDCSMSVRTKVGLGFTDCISQKELGWDDSAFSVFTTTFEDVEGRTTFYRFAKTDSMKAMPPPLTGDYTSLSDHTELDESHMSYGTKFSTSCDPKSVPNDSVSCDDSDKSSEDNTNDLASSYSGLKSSEHKLTDSSCASTSSVSTSVNGAEIDSNVVTPTKEPISV